MLDTGLRHVEGGRHREYRLAVLDGHHPPGGEGPAVADPLDVVDDRNRRVAGPDEVGVQRVDVAVVGHRPSRGDQCLGGDLATEDTLDALLRATPSEDVELDLLQVEQVQELL
ncbi:hypothetical protein GCM10018952_28900 [Streptosporangium vulgare]